MCDSVLFRLALVPPLLVKACVIHDVGLCPDILIDCVWAHLLSALRAARSAVRFVAGPSMPGGPLDVFQLQAVLNALKCGDQSR